MKVREWTPNWREGKQKECALETCRKIMRPKPHENQSRWKRRAHCDHRCAGSAQPSDWTPEMAARLVELHGLGRSFTQIAEAMGITRNQVAGKADRLGLEAPIPEQKIMKLANIEIRPAPIDTRDGKGCRYILEEPRRYCCAPTIYAGKGRSGNWVWCAEHRALVYLPPRQKAAA